MRYLFASALLLALAACGGDGKKDNITGKWTSVFDAAHPPPPGYTDTFCFFGKDSFYIRIFLDKQLQQDTRGTYRFDEKTNKLSTVSPRGAVTFDVQDVKADTLRLNDGQGGLATFHRVK
ncbi:MAG: hypothetical protein EOO08_00895 [Chitinophagaceae bacterium]|nr:MAG: hypothetical protein EOO08_00895 [Chitinophagaceae bacterium]